MTTTDSHHILRLLGTLDRFLVVALDPILKQIGIGREHWQVLRLLEDRQGHPMGEVRDALGLPGATTTRVVDLLVTNMLVYRRSDPLDRRRVLVHLAEPGAQHLRRIEASLSEHIGPVLLDFDAQGREALLFMLERLAGVAAETPSHAIVENVPRE